VCALALGHFVKPREDTPARVLLWCAPGALLLFFGYRALISRPLAPTGGYGAPALEGAVNFMKNNDVTGAMFNEPALGAELIGATAPVFVDERPGLYQDSFLAEARDWPRSFRSLDSVYRFDYAVVANRRANAPARVIDGDARWRLAYADDRALVYVQRYGRNRALAAQSPFRLVAPNRLWPDSLDEALRPPTTAAALDELERWSALAPDSAQALLWKAYAFSRLNRPADADRALARALALPALDWDPQLQAEAAFVLAVRGRDGEAREVYRRAARAARRLDDEVLARAIAARAAR
jgi:tetratricopeptide (TPR) repeat protein